MSSYIEDIISRKFEEYGLAFNRDKNILPNGNDASTFFMSSGMQRFKERFKAKDGGETASLQSCLRLDDLDLVGDGSHLSYFEMLGNFSFGGNDYYRSIVLWHEILKQLAISVDSVHVHPSQNDHKGHWIALGYGTVDDTTCVWTDGKIGGHCCEIYSKGLEIGNLVNTEDVSTDVGFGWERLHQVVEQKDRVEESSLFEKGICPIVNDLLRALTALKANGIKPGNKGREYVCRKLLRRLLNKTDALFNLEEWIVPERRLREDRFAQGRRMLKRHGSKSDMFWWDTFGILPEERSLLR